MNISERVSIHNIVVRFLTKQEDANEIASRTGMKIYQFGDINRYVLSDDITASPPKIYDATGLIFSPTCQEKSLESKLWVSEFVKDLVEV